MNWTCPKCKKHYVMSRKEWRARGHCAVCEVASWTPEKLAETEAVFAEARPAILKALTERPAPRELPSIKFPEDPTANDDDDPDEGSRLSGSELLAKMARGKA